MSTAASATVDTAIKVAQPGRMAGQEREKHMSVDPAEDYDYESLPPNFSLAANMAAGAFAGIAVRWSPGVEE